MRGERGNITNDGEGTREPVREAVWTVALRPQFGPYVGGWSRTAVKTAPLLLMIAFVAGLVIAALVDAYGFNGRRLVLIVYSTLGGSALLLCAWRATAVIRRWKALSTPEGVREHIERRRIRPEDHAREHAAGAVRSIWGALAGPRWEDIETAAAAFDLPSPRMIVIDPDGRFRTLPRHVEDSLCEPEEINEAPTGNALRARIRSITTFALIATVLFAVFPSLIGVGPWRTTNALVLGGVMVALWLYEVYRPARSSWWAFGSAGESVIAAPSLIVVRSPRQTRVFTPRDSVLVVGNHPRVIKEVRVVIARSHRERVVLRFAGPNDERLLALWTMWNHPRASRWDDAAEQVVPEPGPSIASDFPVENAGN
jgi:hypothetical protein